MTLTINLLESLQRRWLNDVQDGDDLCTRVRVELVTLDSRPQLVKEMRVVL